MAVSRAVWITNQGPLTVPQPPTYDRQFSFTDWQASNPADPLPAAQVEIELNAVKTTLDAVLANLVLIQRDDGFLANLSVGNDQLEVSLRTGINPPDVWTVAATVYAVNDTTYFDDGSGRSELWLCVTAHTSTSDFDTDSMVSLNWSKLADWSAIGLEASTTTYDNTSSGLTATDVQAAVDEINTSVAAGIADGDKGDITVASAGTVWTIDANAIVAAKIATDAVESAKIKALAVTTGKIATSNITTALLNASAVTAAKIATNAVETVKIKNVNVTTAKIALNAITLALLEHGTEGDILYYGASGAPLRLAKGADGAVLKLASGLPAWAPHPALIAPVATTSGTANGFTGIAAGANLIEFKLDGVSFTTGAKPAIQIGDSGGYEATGYQSNASNGDSSDTSLTSFLLTQIGNSGYTWNGVITLSRFEGNKWLLSGNLEIGNGEQKVNVSAGTKTLTGELDRIQIIGGTFDAGQIMITVR